MSEQDAKDWRESVKDWREAAQDFCDDYHAELERRIDAESRIEAARALACNWEAWDGFAQDNYGEDPRGRDYARALRAVLETNTEESA